VDGCALEIGKVPHIEAAIIRTAGNNDGAGAGAFGIGKSDDKAILRVGARLQMGDLIRNRHFGSDLLRLGVGAAHQGATGNPGWKTEVILDPRRRTGLAAEGVAIQHQHRKALGRRIDGRG
jgi:hypothetical protein